MPRKKTSPVTDHDVPTQIKNQELVSERRRQLVDSTVQLFIEHGYHKTTTRMIAKAAGFSIGSLYEYVSSKEDLLYLVCKAIHEEVQDAVEEGMADNVGEKELLAGMIRQYFMVCDKMSDHILLMYQVTQFLPDKWQERVLVNELNITDIFIRILGRMSGKHNFPDLDEKIINLVGHNISVLGHMWAFRRWHMKKNFTLEQYTAIQTDVILGLLY
ncbi:MAG: TetR/AcrR family transcriptional regulator [Desulfobacter sp.]|nr:MAG: TetR/AcrR family transcriptional regulator [Desulfobacter sp.]